METLRGSYDDEAPYGRTAFGRPITREQWEEMQRPRQHQFTEQNAGMFGAQNRRGDGNRMFGGENAGCSKQAHAG